MTARGKGRILLLEDSAEVRILLERRLANAGYEVLTAEDAVEAGKLVVQKAPALIIADIQLPYMSGDEFVAALRADPAVRDIPVIFLSVDAHLQEHARRSGLETNIERGETKGRPQPLHAAACIRSGRGRSRPGPARPPSAMPTARRETRASRR